jgi:uncharacterized protein YlxW (UPF0749 family)
VSITAVAVVLGFLVVLQIRSQNPGAELASRSAQELTVLVANLNTQNEGLRDEVARLGAELSDVQAAKSRGESSLDQLREDIARVRAWAGLDSVRGPGVTITVGGPIDSIAVADLLNELRSAGAEALAVQGSRIVPGAVVGGRPGALTVGDSQLPDPFTVQVLGSPETITGSLTRAGGIVALLGATFPAVTVTVTPTEQILLPATTRNLTPANGTPRL